MAVGEVQRIQGFPAELDPESTRIQLVKNLLGDIGDQVAIMVHPQYITYDLFFCRLYLPGHHLFDRGQGPAKIMNGRPTGHFCCNGCQNILGGKAAVFYVDIRKLDDDPRVLFGEHAENTIVGSYKYMVIEFYPDIPIRNATGTVDGYQVNGAFGEVVVYRSQSK